MKKWTPEGIRAFRDKLGLTQQAFGVLTGVSREYINFLEGSKRTPSQTFKLLLDCLEKRHENENVKDKGGEKGHGKGKGNF